MMIEMYSEALARTGALLLWTSPTMAGMLLWQTALERIDRTPYWVIGRLHSWTSSATTLLPELSCLSRPSVWRMRSPKPAICSPRTSAPSVMTWAACLMMLLRRSVNWLVSEAYLDREERGELFEAGREVVLVAIIGVDQSVHFLQSLEPVFPFGFWSLAATQVAQDRAGLFHLGLESVSAHPCGAFVLAFLHCDFKFRWDWVTKRFRRTRQLVYLPRMFLVATRQR